LGRAGAGASTGVGLRVGVYGNGVDPRHFGGGGDPSGSAYHSGGGCGIFAAGSAPPPGLSLAPSVSRGFAGVYFPRHCPGIQPTRHPGEYGFAGAPVGPAVNLGQTLARCVSTGQAMDLDTVHQLWQKGWDWGQSLLTAQPKPYYILGECVVGGTTTALAVLTGLGVRAQGRVSSSHPQCNHAQKWQVVQAGLQRAGDLSNPWAVVAAVGDPMQVVVAAITLALHRDVPILLAGGTQMLAVWGLIQSIAAHENLPWQPERVLVGTTGWVVHDPSAQAVNLAQDLGAPLVSADLDFSHSQYEVLRVYEQGFVKEGVAAGGCALSAHWYRGWGNEQVLTAVESLLNAAGHSPDVPAPSAPPLP
jgi:uncharacterized protein (TIGR00303 family)